MEIQTFPYGDSLMVIAEVVATALGAKRYPITFLIDTGADVTTISPFEARAYGFNFKNFKRPKNPSIGVGGRQTCEFFIEDVYLRFKTKIKGRDVIRRLAQMDIIRPGKGKRINPMPSLMGVDLLKDFKLTFGTTMKLES